MNIKEVENIFLDTEGHEVEILKGFPEDLIVRNLEVEQHDSTDYQKEKDVIIDVCKKYNLKFESEILDGGYPKLNFKYNKEDS